MNRFDFTVTLDQLIDDLDVIDEFYGRCDDASMFNSGGVTKITFHREAASLDDAIRSAIDDARTLGAKVTHIEVEPECVGA